MSEELILKFDPQTIEHLGIKMYSQLPYALAELVANAYDAGASKVDIYLEDRNADNKRIIISDDGEGMSYEDVQEKFLVIGRRRRDSDVKRVNAKGRKITGRKGLGKLALFGIGKNIQISTTRRGEVKKTLFVLNWDDILQESTGTYKPKSKQIIKNNKEEEGTTIVLTNLSRTTAFDIERTAISLSKMFNCFDSSFAVKLHHNEEETVELSKELRYQDIEEQFQWNIEDIVAQLNSEYEYRNNLKGCIISSEKPMKQALRGITLYVNGRLANTESFFGYSEAGHALSYISGWIEADYLDELDNDIISTDRQSLSWDTDEAEELQILLQQIVKYLVNDWSTKRKKVKGDRILKRTGVNTREWFENVPTTIRPKLERVIVDISEKHQIDDEDYSNIVKQVYDLIPPYTYYHYRLLHKDIQQASEEYYKNGQFYQAFFEAMKRYKNAVKQKSGVSKEEDFNIVSEAFGKSDKAFLKTTVKFQKKPNGEPFSERTLENIEEGQKFLSMGIVAGGRNVLSHEEMQDLKESGLFTEMDCLDMLSTLSHLFKRLDDAERK